MSNFDTVLLRVGVMLSTSPGSNHGCKVRYVEHPAKRCKSVFKTAKRRIAFDKIMQTEVVVDTHGLLYLKGWAETEEQAVELVSRMKRTISRMLEQRMSILREMLDRNSLPGTATRHKAED